MRLAVSYEHREGAKDKHARAALQAVVPTLAEHARRRESLRRKGSILFLHDDLTLLYKAYAKSEDMTAQQLDDELREFFDFVRVPVTDALLDKVAFERDEIRALGGPRQASKVCLGKVLREEWRTVHDELKRGPRFDEAEAFGNTFSDSDLVAYLVEILEPHRGDRLRGPDEMRLRALQDACEQVAQLDKRELSKQFREWDAASKRTID